MNERIHILKIQGNEYPVSILEKADRDAWYLGAILQNLLLLDYKIKSFLNTKDKNFQGKLPRFEDLQRGDEVNNPPKGFKQNFFGDTVDKFNAMAPSEVRIEEEIKDLRNALAHGIIASHDFPIRPQHGTFKIVKQRYEKKKLKIENVYEMTDCWLSKTLDYSLCVLLRTQEYINKETGIQNLK